LSIERRSTKQKQAIRAVMAEQEHPLLPDEIHALALQEVPSLGIATVYRTLKTLQEEGQVCCVEIPGQSPRYERSDKGHHHHFHCMECHTVFDLEKCVDGLKKLAPPGFKVSAHEITLHGHCKSCA
jgi:Fur family transcriptional regulator, ferric uptake regulator